MRDYSCIYFWFIILMSCKIRIRILEVMHVSFKCFLPAVCSRGLFSLRSLCQCKLYLNWLIHFKFEPSIELNAQLKAYSFNEKQYKVMPLRFLKYLYVFSKRFSDFYKLIFRTFDTCLF